MTALGVPLASQPLARFPINYQLLHRVIIVLGLQMTEGESTAVRTTGWTPGHESSWCLQRPRTSGLISQNSFCYSSVPFISLMGTLSSRSCPVAAPVKVPHPRTGHWAICNIQLHQRTVMSLPSCIHSTVPARKPFSICTWTCLSLLFKFPNL